MVKKKEKEKTNSHPLDHVVEILNGPHSSPHGHGHNIYMCNHGNISLLLGMNSTMRKHQTNNVMKYMVLNY